MTRHPRNIALVSAASFVIAFGGVATIAVAQPRVTVVDQFGEADWSGRVTTDSVRSVLPVLVLQDYRARGYWSAVIDSISSPAPSTHYVYVTAGSPARIRSIRMGGLDSSLVERASEVGLQRQAPLPEPEALLDEVALGRSVRAILDDLARAGFPLARASIDVERHHPDGAQAFTEKLSETSREPENGPIWLDVTILFDTGQPLRLTRVQVADEIRTGRRLLARLAGLRIGSDVTTFDAEEARRRLQATGLFADVGEVQLAADGAGGATLTVPLVERAPGKFDIVLGYLSDPGGGGSLVGNGHIVLDNLFGGGRTLSMRLNRPSGRTSTLDAEIQDPFLVGTAIGIAGTFSGEQRDSTYSRQSYRLEGSYRVSTQFALTVSGRRTVTRPGQAGLSLSGGRQRVPRSASLAAGFGIRYSTVVNPTNPRSGLEVETRYERGTKELTLREASGGVSGEAFSGDTLSVVYREKQERLFATSRYYSSLASRHVVAVGADAEAVVSDRYDPADLIRFGGANSLRGYNEQQFAGRFVARGLLEYRYLLDRESFLFAFFDLGYVEFPRLDTAEDGAGPQGRGTYPGFGFGIQFEAPIGLMTATYALNADDGPLNGKVHVGLSFAL